MTQYRDWASRMKTGVPILQLPAFYGAWVSIWGSRDPVLRLDDPVSKPEHIYCVLEQLLVCREQE